MPPCTKGGINMSKQVKVLWIKNGKENETLVERKSMMCVFQGIAKGFEDDNEISKKLVNEIIPTVKEIQINYDFNETQDIPVIYCVMENRKKNAVLKIKRYHKIVWSIFNKYCS